jgi:hypothetical protein
MNLTDITKQIRAFADELDAEKAPEQPASFNLPTPPPGMQWHRTDGWKAEDLPQGTRPLARLEQPREGDEQISTSGWIKQSVNDRKLLPDETQVLQRTTRPLLFAHEGHEWTWHRAGDPMPCDGERIVEFLLGNGLVGGKGKACGLHWKVEKGKQLADHHLIIGWRYADAVDPYAELKAAHAAGKVIQMLDNVLWNDLLTEPQWETVPLCDLRIKPDDSPPWIEWHGGPCPLKDDEMEILEYQLADRGRTSQDSKPSELRWPHVGSPGDIIAYRVLKAKKPAPKQPLGPSDVPPGSVLLSSSAGVNGMQWTQVLCVKSRGVEINGRDCITWAELKEHWKINRPRHRDENGNPTLWEACER